MKKILAFLAVLYIAAFAQQTGVTIAEAQKVPGVYVKIGNRFVLIRKQNMDFLFDNQSMYTAILLDAAFQPPKIPINSQLVVVGITSAAMSRIAHNGYTIPYEVEWGSGKVGDLGKVVENSKIGIRNYNYVYYGSGTAWFEKINGKDPYEYTSRMIYTRRNYNLMQTHGIFTAAKNEKFSLGRFEGTAYKEVKLIANKRFFTYGVHTSGSIFTHVSQEPNSTRENITITRTMNGYFEINFQTPPSGYYYIHGIGVVEFDGRLKEHYEKGMDNYNKKEYDQAIKEFTEVIKLNANFMEAYFYRGHAYSEKEDYDHAIADYEQALRLKPDLAEIQTALATAKITKKAEAASPLSIEVTEESTILRGSTLVKKLVWLNRNAKSDNIYIIEINADEDIIPYKFEYKDATNVTIVLRGDNENRTIRLQSNGNMFAVKPNVTFVLDNNITLHGHNGNNGNMINVEGGTLKMYDGATITGNTTFGGVYVKEGTFEMNGGIISGNGKNTDFYGGGVDNRSTFIMNGGTISGNTAFKGGGVYVREGTFTMRGGTIEGNIGNRGGGVYRESDGNFIMEAGTITGNTAREYGGGVYVNSGYGVKFTKDGGTITGYNSDQSKGNVVKDDNGVIADRGHAVYVDGRRRKETTVEPEMNLSTSDNVGWDD